MKKLGIIGAMAVEIETLKSQMTDMTEHQHASMTFYEGTLESLPVVLVVCGVFCCNSNVFAVS